MASIVSSTAAVTSMKRAAPAPTTMVAPFSGLKSTAGFPINQKTNDITTLASNGGKVHAVEVSPPRGLKKFETLAEVEECKKEYPDAHIRVIGYDNNRQVQCISFIAYKPPNSGKE